MESRCPNQRNVIIASQCQRVRSARHPKAGTSQQLFHLGFGGEAKVAGDAVLDRRRGGGESERLLPALILQSRRDQSAAEGIARANAIDYFHLIARSPMELAFRQKNRAPAIEPDQWILAQCHRNRGETESLLQLARDRIILLTGKVLVGVPRRRYAEHQATVLLRGHQYIHVS